MIRGFPSCGARHVFNDDRRVAGNMFFQGGKQRARLQVSGAAGLAAANDLDGFILKIGSLGGRLQFENKCKRS